MSHLPSSEMVSPARKSEDFASSGTITGGFGAVTLAAPQSIGNPTETAGKISFHMVDDPPETIRTDYFIAGQYKPLVVDKVYDLAAGSTVNSRVIGR